LDSMADSLMDIDVEFDVSFLGKCLLLFCPTLTGIRPCTIATGRARRSRVCQPRP
jgi:hypothetical protein